MSIYFVFISSVGAQTPCGLHCGLLLTHVPGVQCWAVGLYMHMRTVFQPHRHAHRVRLPHSPGPRCTLKICWYTPLGFKKHLLFKGKLCENYRHLTVELCIAPQLMVHSSASLFQTGIATGIATTLQRIKKPLWLTSSTSVSALPRKENALSLFSPCRWL